MEELQRLINIIERYNTKAVLIDFNDGKNYESRYYNLVKQNEVSSDLDAAKVLYDSDGKVLPTSYRMLKSRLKKKLYTHLHLVSLNDISANPSRILEHELQSLLYEGKLLFILSELELSNKVLEKAIRQAKEYEFNDIILQGLEAKRRIDIYKQDKVSFDKLNKEIKHYKNLVFLEKDAEDLFSEIKFNLNFQVSRKEASLLQLPDKIAEIKRLWLKSKSYKIFEHYILLQNHYLELTGNYKELLKFCLEVEKMHLNKEVNYRRFDIQLNVFVKLYAYLRTGRLEEGIKLAEANLYLISPSDVNWFAYLENYFLLAMHSQNFTLAEKLITDVYESPYYYVQSALSKERWALMRAFLSIVTQGRLTKDDKEALDNATMVSKDKQGFNVFLLVLEFIELLNNEVEEEAELLIERYRKYIDKYLRGDMPERARLFLRFMILILKENYSYLQVVSKSTSMHEKLKATTPPGEAYAEVEIVPYEHLWELILSILKEKSGLDAE